MTNDKDKRKGWLLELKVGDAVGVYAGHRYSSHEVPSKCYVHHITPTGYLDVASVRIDSPEASKVRRHRYDQTGYSSVSRGDRWCPRAYLVQWTEEEARAARLRWANNRVYAAADMLKAAQFTDVSRCKRLVEAIQAACDEEAEAVKAVPEDTK